MNLDTTFDRLSMIDEKVNAKKQLFFPSVTKESDEMREIEQKLQLQEVQQKEDEQLAAQHEKEEQDKKQKEKIRNQRRKSKLRKPGK